MKTKTKTILMTGIIWISFFLIMMYIAGRWAVTKHGFDTDLLWHIKIGEDILAKKEIFLE